MPKPTKPQTEPTPPETKNPFLASVGKFAKEPLWDAPQEEMRQFREERNEAVDSDAAPIKKAS